MDRFPTYTLGERVADGCIHLIGVAASVVGAAILITLSIGQLPAMSVASVAIYSVGLVAVFGFSAGYHLVSPSPLKALLRRFDHAAIYLKIAATYTPFAAIKMGGSPGLALLGLVWAITTLGVVAKLFFPGRFMRTAYFLYLGQGWACLAVLDPLTASVSTQTLVLLVVGGMLYTVGVAFHLWHRLRYHNAIWHAFVVAASCCHFAAVFDAILLPKMT